MDDLLGSARMKKVRAEKLGIHPVARDAFTFSQGLVFQCNTSLLRTSGTGTFWPVPPIVIKNKAEYLVINAWSGLLISECLASELIVIVVSDLSVEQIIREAWRYVLGLLALQVRKDLYHGYLAELVERFPPINSPCYLKSSFQTPRAFSYSISPCDEKAVDTQLSRLRYTRIKFLGSS